MDDGLAKAIGLSNASLPQVEEILAAAKHKPVVNQVRCSGGWGNMKKWGLEGIPGLLPGTVSKSPSLRYRVSCVIGIKSRSV